MTISGAEWEVLRVVWALEKATSKAIIEVLGHQLGWSDSTIKTLLGRLVDKDVLQANRQGRQFIYQARLAEAEAYDWALQGVLSKICQRQHFGLLLAVLRDLPMTAADHAALEALLLTKQNQLIDQVPCNCLPGQCGCEKGCDMR